MTTEAPDWIKQIPQLSRKDELGWDRFNKGAGVTITSQKSLYVKGNQEDVTTTEGAIAERGFSDGRHVFAFMWSRDQRHVPNAHLAVGIGYPFDMNGEYYGPLVGGNDKSYGFNLTDNGLYFCGSRVAVFPPKKDQSFCLPTLFFMYVDLIESKLGFGGENEFWGVAFDFSEKRPMKEVPLYPMVAFANVTGKFMMFYKGQGLYFWVNVSCLLGSHDRTGRPDGLFVPVVALNSRGTGLGSRLGQIFVIGVMHICSNAIDVI